MSVLCVICYLADMFHQVEIKMEKAKTGVKWVALTSEGQ